MIRWKEASFSQQTDLRRRRQSSPFSQKNKLPPQCKRSLLEVRSQDEMYSSNSESFRSISLHFSIEKVLHAEFEIFLGQNKLTCVGAPLKHEAESRPCEKHTQTQEARQVDASPIPSHFSLFSFGKFFVYCYDASPLANDEMPHSNGEGTGHERAE